MLYTRTVQEAIEKNLFKPPKDFVSAYPESEFTVIRNDNYLRFL